MRAIILAVLALTACNRVEPGGDYYPSPNREATGGCYTSALEHRARPDVRAIMADRFISERECSNVIMPLIRAANDAYDNERRAAVRAEWENGGNGL